MILEDLLFVLMGIEGNHITYHPNYSAEEDDPLRGVRFVVSPSLDSSLRDLVERVLPLGTYYTAITSFIEQRSHLDFGLVNHALCAAIRDMLKVLVYSLYWIQAHKDMTRTIKHFYPNSNTLSTLHPNSPSQKLWFYVH
ncbi:hypothetical protein MPER_10512, partial [Moniliophthora perniciosa FA553]